MPNIKRTFARKKDFIVVAVLLLFAGGWLTVRGLSAVSVSGVQADIYFDSRLVKTVILTPDIDTTFAVPGQPNVLIQAHNGTIRFYSSTCRDKLCTRWGYLSRPGESAACLPNRVAVKLVAVGEGGRDKPDTYIS